MLDKFELFPVVRDMIQAFRTNRQGRTVNIQRGDILVDRTEAVSAQEFLMGLVEQKVLARSEERTSANRHGGLALLVDYKEPGSESVLATKLHVDAFGGNDLQTPLLMESVKIDPALIEGQGKQVGKAIAQLGRRILVGGLDPKEHPLGFGLFKIKGQN